MLRRLALMGLTSCLVATTATLPVPATASDPRPSPTTPSTATATATATATDSRIEPLGKKKKNKKTSGAKGKAKPKPKPPPVRGTAIVRVRGTRKPRITLRGPGSFQRVLRRSARIKNLRPGRYVITAPPVVRSGGVVRTRVVNRRFRVTDARRRVTARIVYDFTPTPDDRQPPASVSGLRVVNRAPRHVSLAWGPPGDPDLAQVVVRRTVGPQPAGSPAEGEPVPVAAGAVGGTVDRGLRPETTYSYAVFTRDTMGNVSALPMWVTVRTSMSQIFAAGDIGWCGGRTAQTARLIPTGSPFLGLGDLAYYSGKRDEFRRCYHPFYGRLRGTTYPTPGNHEYRTGARGYRAYFGHRVGTRAKPWYVVRFGSWTILMLDSDCDLVGGCGTASAQYKWIKATLGDQPPSCLAAAWHHPQWVTGRNAKGRQPTGAIYRLLAGAGADFVLNGHIHRYERFERTSPDGYASGTGIRQFVVGTGGAPLKGPDLDLPTVEATVKEHGVLRLSLDRAAYSWQFVSIGGQIRDAGSDVCEPA